MLCPTHVVRSIPATAAKLLGLSGPPLTARTAWYSNDFDIILTRITSARVHRHCSAVVVAYVMLLDASC